MAVYVDNVRIPFRGMRMSHMIADDLGELHDMAIAIGMKREWFQENSFPHYDVSDERRVAALALGAAAVERKELVLVMRRYRAVQAKAGYCPTE